MLNPLHLIYSIELAVVCKELRTYAFFPIVYLSYKRPTFEISYLDNFCHCGILKIFQYIPCPLLCIESKNANRIELSSIVTELLGTEKSNRTLDDTDTKFLSVFSININHGPTCDIQGAKLEEMCFKERKKSLRAVTTHT